MATSLVDPISGRLISPTQAQAQSVNPSIYSLQYGEFQIPVADLGYPQGLTMADYLTNQANIDAKVEMVGKKLALAEAERIRTEAERLISERKTTQAAARRSGRGQTILTGKSGLDDEIAPLGSPGLVGA